MNTPNQMFPMADQDSTTLEYWLADLFQDPVIADVVETDAFLRLGGVSFLGAIEYAYPTLKLDKTQRSRAQHSLHVAALANYVATKRGYDESLKRHVILAGLLHDIGHLPLSHSTEPHFKASLGLGHHQLGEQIIRGENTLGRELHSLLKDSTDLEFLSRLIAGEASDTESGDLFSSAINIDTIDGIVRTCAAMATEPVNINRLAVAHAVFVDESNSRYKVMDDFWTLKHFVYEHMINNVTSLLADFSARDYFEQAYAETNERDLLDTEATWLVKHNNLFQRFKNKGNFYGQKLGYVKRAYRVDTTRHDDQRYTVHKWKSHLNTEELLTDTTPIQTSFYFFRLHNV